MDLSYAAAPLLAWLTAGSLKFLINGLRERRLAFDLIGYGGLPSNHAAIVSATATLIALREGLDHPAFGVAVTLAFIVLLDAGGLRRHVGRHAERINRLSDAETPLRERIGHSKVEMAAGIVTGAVVGTLLWWIKG